MRGNRCCGELSRHIHHSRDFKHWTGRLQQCKETIAYKRRDTDQEFPEAPRADEFSSPLRGRGPPGRHLCHASKVSGAGPKSRNSIARPRINAPGLSLLLTGPYAQSGRCHEQDMGFGP